MIDLPITVGFRHDRVMGRIKLDEELEKLLVDGEIFILSVSIVRTIEGNKLRGITLLPQPATPKRAGW